MDSKSGYGSRIRGMCRLTALLLTLGLPLSPSFAQQVSIPGTSVSLDAPDGFTLASSFSGLENLQDGSSILVAELPGEAYSQLLPLFTDLDTATSSFRQQGVLVDRTRTYGVGEQQVPALIGTQPIPGGELGKYIALFRGDVTVMMTFNAFDPTVLTPSVVEDVVLSVRLAPAATLEERLAQLPFSFRAAAPFRPGSTIGGSAVMLPSIEGTDPTGRAPLIIITRSLSPVAPTVDLGLASRQLLVGTRGFENAQVSSIREVEFAGGAGALLEAASGERMIVQFLRIPPDGMYVRLVATGETSALNSVMPSVTEIADSVVIR